MICKKYDISKPNYMKICRLFNLAEGYDVGSFESRKGK